MSTYTILITAFLTFGSACNKAATYPYAGSPELTEVYGPISGEESKFRSKIVQFAKNLRGVGYKYGGKNPKGFDCSGFISYVFQNFDIELARSSSAQANQGKKKSIRQLEPGDLIFFGNNGKVNHVGMFIESSGKGGITMIHSSSSKGVIIEDIADSPYWQKRLLFGKEMIDL